MYAYPFQYLLMRKIWNTCFLSHRISHSGNVVAIISENCYILFLIVLPEHKTVYSNKQSVFSESIICLRKTLAEQAKARSWAHTQSYTARSRRSANVSRVETTGVCPPLCMPTIESAQTCMAWTFHLGQLWSQFINKYMNRVAIKTYHQSIIKLLIISITYF